MKNKITLLFAALMMTLGVSAQTLTEEQKAEIAQRGAEKGYYPFAAEITGMEKLTSLDQIENGMEIMIKHSHEGTDQTGHEGSYLTIYSLPTYGAAHIVFMQEKPVEVGVWTTNTVNAQDGTFKLQSAHGVITNSTCYLGQLEWNLTPKAYLSTTGIAEYVGVYKFVPATDGSGRWNIQCTNTETYLSVTANSKGDPTISEAYSIDKNCYFEIYGVKEKSTEQVKYVENAQVHLIGPSGNIVTTTHTGWNDFYEFIMYSGSAQKSVNYGISISNVLYHENQNQITASIKHAFPISGNVAKIPVHLCPKGSENLRISIVDGNLKVVEKPANGWVKDKNNQWYIFPKYDNKDFTYAIQNVGTGQYINFTSTYTSSNIITLGQTPSYFTLGANTAGTYLNFEFKYTNDKSATYTYCLYGDIQDLKDYNQNLLIPAYQLGAYSKNSYYTAENFLVPAVSAAELDGVPAIGFTRYFHEDTYFWDGGEIADEKVPDAVKSNRGSTSHEGYNKGTHKVYSAETEIIVTQTGTVTAQFDYISGQNALQILGVDIVTKDANKNVVSFDYHLGKAGTPSQGNLYLLENVEEGEYLLRYWVCNRTDLEGWEGHNLKNVRGKIKVSGANYNLLKSEAPREDAFHANTTWFRMRLCDGLEKYISAQPAYTDWHNNLKVSNNTPPSDYAGLWCIVGDEENGYKFYNRAWGPAYAMKTEGDEEGARTYMVLAGEASTYDIVQQEGNYQFFVKVHGEGNKFLNDRGGYLATWNNSAALGNSGSVMSFETVNMEGWEANTEVVENELKNLWAPWKNANSDINTAYETYTNNSTFASLVSERQQLAELLDGKVFKFVNQGTDIRKDMLLTVNGEGKGAGLTVTGNSEDYMQFIDNGDGTFKLFHIATARYLGVPDGAVTTTKSSEAAAYTYTFQDAEHKEQLTFQTSDQTLHLKNVDNYIFMNHGDNDDASRWTVFYGEAEAQDLGAVAIEAQEMLERITTDKYLANAGQPGHASQKLIEEYKTAIQGLSGKTEVKAKEILEAAMQKIKDAEYIHQYVTALTLLSNTGIYGIHCERGPLAYVAGNSTTHLSTPKLGSAEDITANVVANENEQFAILRTENTPEGWYYLYNITTQKFVSKDFKLTENPVCAVNFRDIYAYDTNYRWEVWFGEIINGEKVDQKLNVNLGNGLILESGAGMDAGNKFRIEYAETNEAKTAPALALIKVLETAKAEATAFLNSTPETIGYPLEAARTTFANEIVAAASISEVETAKANFVASRDIVMPENGKAYKISAWWRGRTWPLTFVDDSNKPGYACATPAYAPVEKGTATVFVCRKLENGTYAFVSDNGYYLGWQTDAENTNATKTEFAGATYWKVEKSRTDNNSGDLNSEEIFGKVNIVAERTTDNWYDYMFNCDDKKFHNGQPGAKHYGDNGNTVYYIFEEVDYTLNKVTLTAISAEDELINGLEGAIGTFSAPYATVIPEGVTAYYANATLTGAENSSAILEVVEGAIPAGEGVILVGGAAGQVEMLPATSEPQATLENNYLIGTGATPVAMQTGDFILARDDDQGIGFYQATPGSTLRAGKAYIQFGGTVNSLVLRFGGNTTDIDAVTTITPSNDELIYDIYGRRVTEVKKGNIYIKNGKKFIVK